MQYRKVGANNYVHTIFFFSAARFDSLHALHKDIREDFIASFLYRHPNEDPRLGGVYLHLAELASTPRTIKTHLPFSLLPPDILETSKVQYAMYNYMKIFVSTKCFPSWSTYIHILKSFVFRYELYVDHGGKHFVETSIFM